MIADQFDEHFIQGDRSERAVVFGLLAGLESFGEPGTHVVATMRADYLADLDRVAPDLCTVQKAQSVDPHEMQRDWLAPAIGRPLEGHDEQ